MFSKLKSLLKKSRPSTSPARESDKTDQSLSEDLEIKAQALQISAPQSVSGKKRVKGKTKQGLPVFHADQDLGLLFGVDDEDPSQKKGPETPSGRDKSNDHKRKETFRYTKHGFPVLDRQEDLESLMDQAKGDDAPSPPAQINECKKKEKDPPPLTKHGIRILQNGDMPFEREEIEQDERFEDLLYVSLGQKKMNVLLHEKKDSEKKRKKLTLKQRLKAYPAPQGQLDLHGYTALKAELRVESYLKSVYYNQTHTVNIIVGKGLHSDEGAVLPDVVETKLNAMKKEGIVLAYDWDNKRKSRSGSVIVYLDNRFK